MNKVGEINVGIIITLFLAVIVGLVLFQGSASYVGNSINTQTLTNRTFTAPAVNGTIDLIGQELINTPIVTNASSGVTVSSGNYTITETISATDGLKRISYRTKDTSPYASRSVNISYVYGPEGYIEDSSSRSVAGLILILSALALAIYVISRVVESAGIVFNT